MARSRVLRPGVDDFSGHARKDRAPGAANQSAASG